MEGGRAVPVAPGLPCSIAETLRLMMMMNLPLPPTGEQHTMDTGSAFFQGKEVARKPKMMCLPEGLDAAAERVGDVTEVRGEAAGGVDVIAGRHGSEWQLLSAKVHILSRRRKTLPGKAGMAGVGRSDSVGSEQLHQEPKPPQCSENIRSGHRGQLGPFAAVVAWQSGMASSGCIWRPDALNGRSCRGTVGYGYREYPC